MDKFISFHSPPNLPSARLNLERKKEGRQGELALESKDDIFFDIWILCTNFQLQNFSSLRTRAAMLLRSFFFCKGEKRTW